jgi:hypothetical protein
MVFEEGIVGDRNGSIIKVSMMVTSHCFYVIFNKSHNFDCH